MVIKLSRVKGNQYSRTESIRLNTLLDYASGHDAGEVFAKALSLGISYSTARRYMKKLREHIAKKKSISRPSSIEIVQKEITNPYDKTEVIIGSGSDILLKPISSSKDDNTISID